MAAKEEPTLPDPSSPHPAPGLSPLQREWQAFWLALGFLTRIPLPVRIDYSQGLMNRSSLYFPLVGLLLGALYAVAYTILALLWDPLICLLLVLVLHLWLTGAFHEDGLADSLDALGGGYTVTDRLRIMKDSRIGTYGTVALVLALALKVALLAETDPVWLALLVSPCVGRLTPLVMMRTMRYISDPDASRTKPVAEAFSSRRLAVAGGFVALVCLVLMPWLPLLPLLAAAAVGLVALAWGHNLQRTLGGYTGDTLGASMVFTELLLLLLIAGH